MDKNHNHWISIYLSGQYPWYYTMPDRLSFFDELKLENPTRYSDVVLWQYQNKNDVEFFYSLLNSFERNHPASYEKLLKTLWVPEKVKNDPRWVKKEEVKENNNKESISLKLSSLFHSSIVSKYVWGIKSKLYDWAFVEAFNILNDRLRNYCNQELWKWEAVEMDAIDIIFNQSKEQNTFNFKRQTETEEWMEVWLSALFEWVIKYYRNPSAHIKNSIKTENEFIDAMMLLSMLLKKMDDSKIKKQ